MSSTAWRGTRRMRRSGIFPAINHKYPTKCADSGVRMTRQLEETIDSLNPTVALRVLDAVDGTLEALRTDALVLGNTPEIQELVRRIDAYKSHLERQRLMIQKSPAIEAP